ncbi:hypothetical protein ACLOJK_022202, partial [Asimina triloba]
TDQRRVGDLMVDGVCRGVCLESARMSNVSAEASIGRGYLPEVRERVSAGSSTESAEASMRRERWSPEGRSSIGREMLRAQMDERGCLQFSLGRESRFVNEAPTLGGRLDRGREVELSQRGVRKENPRSARK